MFNKFLQTFLVIGCIAYFASPNSFASADPAFDDYSLVKTFGWRYEQLCASARRLDHPPAIQFISRADPGVEAWEIAHPSLVKHFGHRIIIEGVEKTSLFGKKSVVFEDATKMYALFDLNILDAATYGYPSFVPQLSRTLRHKGFLIPDDDIIEQFLRIHERQRELYAAKSARGLPLLEPVVVQKAFREGIAEYRRSHPAGTGIRDDVSGK
jgi:hypothetical protein